MAYIIPVQEVITKSIFCSINVKLTCETSIQWQEIREAPFALRGSQNGGNKLRKYKMFKQQFASEPYTYL